MESGKCILWTLAFAVMITIFILSAQTAPQSNKVSCCVTEIIVKIMPSMKKACTEEKRIAAKQLEKTVRKLAHFFLFFLLGIFLMSALFYKTQVISKNLVILFFAICLANAISDEVHQFFVDGRCFQISDILIDMSGAVFGGGLIVLGKTYLNRMRRDNK